MFDHDKCLEIVRKQYPGRAVMSSCKGNGKYFFRLSEDDQVHDYNYTRCFETIAVDENTGKAESFDVFGYRLFELSDEECKKFDEECGASFNFIDAEPKTAYELARM